jgi:hypothetical protein
LSGVCLRIWSGLGDGCRICADFCIHEHPGILIGRWVPDSDFSSGIHEGNSRSVGDVAARRESGSGGDRA